MCGRFTLTLEISELQRELKLGVVSADLAPRYNIAPSQQIAVVTDPDERKIEVMRWGLIPFWAKDKAIGNKLINARSETISEKPSFRNAFQKRRCLIPADGFFEWDKRNREKEGKSIPHYFFLEDHQPFMFAGLWEIWRPAESEDIIYSCTIITCPPNDVVSPYHNRMPVMLDEENSWKWLEFDSQKQLLELLQPFQSRSRMREYSISTLVNSPQNDSAQVIQQINQ